jgi:hypothetical protein
MHELFSYLLSPPQLQCSGIYLKSRVDCPVPCIGDRVGSAPVDLACSSVLREQPLRIVILGTDISR